MVNNWRKLKVKHTIQLYLCKSSVMLTFLTFDCDVWYWGIMIKNVVSNNGKLLLRYNNKECRGPQTVMTVDTLYVLLVTAVIHLCCSWRPGNKSLRASRSSPCVSESLPNSRKLHLSSIMIRQIIHFASEIHVLVYKRDCQNTKTFRKLFFSSR